MRPTRHNFPAPGPRAFTLVEIMMVLTIMSIVAMIGADAISSFEAAQRPDRAAREALAFFRYARHLAMTTGNDAKIQVNTASNTLSIYLMSNGSTWDASPYASSMASGGTLVLHLNTDRDTLYTTLAVAPASTTEFVYNPLGSTCTDPTGTSTASLTGSLTFSFGTHTKTLTIPAVGDPQIN